jgi:alkaline phosphatase
MEREIFEGKDWNGTPNGLEEKALPIVDRGAELTQLTSDDLDRLVSAKGSYDRAAALGLAESRKFGIAFIPFDALLASEEVHGHTGDLVPIRAWGPRASDVIGVRDHASVGRWLREITRLSPAPGT